MKIKKRTGYILICFSIIILSLFTLIYFVNKPRSEHQKIDYYHGIVLNEKLIPLSNVEVTDITTHVTTRTNTRGYFSMKLDTLFLESLIFNKKMYLTDTIPIRIDRYNKAFYRFISIIPDTIVMKKQKISKQIK